MGKPNSAIQQTKILKQNIFHNDLNDNWNINLDRNDINNM